MFNPVDHPEIESIANIRNIAVDFRYATTNNFMGKAVYENFDPCFLHRVAAAKLRYASEELARLKPNWKFLLLDCLRPRSAQKKLWDVVYGTPEQKYVADPARGSMHNYGFAIDLTLIDERGREVDMGTPFDFFGPEAEPAVEDQLLKQGRLSQTQIDNRKLLRSVMVEAGFTPISIEWWHFDALDRATVVRDYKIVE